MEILNIDYIKTHNINEVAKHIFNYLDNSFYLKGSIQEHTYKEIKNKDEKIKKCSIDKGFRNQIIVISTISAEHAKKVAIEQYQIYTQNQMENGEI